MRLCAPSRETNPWRRGAVVFTCLGVPVIVDLLASLLLEKRVLLVSDRIGLCVPVFQNLITLLWPFQFRHEWMGLIPDSLVDWFAQRVDDAKPFFASLCTVDLIPPSDRALPRRQGRVVLREETWSAREKDAAWASERLTTPGCVRQSVAALLEDGTIVVDLDADVTRGGELCSFPPELRDQLISELNLALGRGGVGSGFGTGFGATLDECQSSDVMVREAVHRVYAALVGRCEQFIVTPREDVVSFYRVEFLRSVKPEYLDFVTRLVDTATFAHFCKCGWEFVE
jgi:hypothetical protein